MSNDSLIQMQKELYTVLKTFDDFCKQNDINYFIFYGTLIGAIRHKGFIPWDDDIDVVLTRKEYEKLKSIPKDKYPKGYFLDSLDDVYFLDFVPRFCSERTYYNKDWDEEHSYKLDIFVLDNAYDNDVRFKAHIYRMGLQYLFARGHRKLYKPLRTEHGGLLNHLVKPIMWIGKRMNLRSIYDKYEKLSKNGTSKTLVFASNATVDDIRIRFEKEDFDKTIDMKFEDRMFPAPAGYDHLLRNIYGDYMTLPSIENRKSIH